MSDFKYHDYLEKVAKEDVRFLIERDKTYGGSWKQSGGRSAWFMLARKMDRLREIMKRPDPPIDFDPDEINVGYALEEQKCQKHVDYLLRCFRSEDIFEMIQNEANLEVAGDDGTALAEVRDLRRYLLLVESEMVARGTVKETGNAK